MSGIHGRMYFLPGVTVFPVTWEAYKLSAEKFRAGRENLWEVMLGENVAKCRDIKEIDPLLSRRHEVGHYGQLMSTFYGFTIWQARTCLVDLMLDRWDSSGSKILLSREERLDAAAQIERFCNALQGHAELSMAQFLQVANRAQEYLSQYWGLPRRVWQSRMPHLESYLPPGSPTSSEIIEAGGCFFELNLLGSSPNPLHVELLQQWIATRLHGDYEPATDRLFNAIADPVAAAYVIDQSLMGASFLSTESTSPVFVENVLPSWRLEPLIHQVREVLLPAPLPEKYEYFARTAPLAVGLEDSISTSREVVSAGLVSLFPTAPSLKSVLVDLSDNKYREFVVQRFMQGFNFRADGFSPSLPLSSEQLAQTAEVGGFEPILEIYQDQTLVNHFAMDLDDSLPARAYFELVKTLLVEASIDKTFDLTSLRVVEKAFLSELEIELDTATSAQEDPLEKRKIEALFKVKNIAEGFIGQSIGLFRF